MNAPICKLTPRDAGWPKELARRLGASAPEQLHLLGAPGLPGKPLTALFCSARCPGDAILRTYDQAAHWRDTGRAVISGFHSPMEKECLRILLRGRQPIVLCLARCLPERIAPQLRPALTSGRLVIATSFSSSERRVTSDLAEGRNLLVAALASGENAKIAKTGARKSGPIFALLAFFRGLPVWDLWHHVLCGAARGCMIPAGGRRPLTA